MSRSEARIRELQHIPAFAVRQAMYDLLEDSNTEAALRKRFGHILNRRLQHMRQAVQRMGREQLTALAEACPEISDEQMRHMFEEYRYGSNPSFQVYLFDRTALDRDALEGLRHRLEERFARFDTARDSAFPRMRHLALSGLESLPEKPGVVEGVYRFETRMDYVDVSEQAACTYQMVYGLFWLNPGEGYAIVHTRSPEVLKALKCAIEEAIGVSLGPLIISKQLKNALPFLLRDSFRGGRLHDPDPGPGRFRWLTVADDNPYAKGYEDLEERYPEVRSVRYRETIGDEHETTLTIRCDRGALRLTGTLSASQLRRWTLDRLGQLISILNEFRPDAPTYVQTPELGEAPELAQFNPIQRAHIVRIVSALLTAKQTPLLGHHSLGVNALQLAADMGNLFKMQIPVEHVDTAEEGAGYLACPMCNATTLGVKAYRDSWELECREHKQQRWTTLLPVVVDLGWQEQVVLDDDDLASVAELLPSEMLLQAVADVVGRHLPGYTFDPRRESFIVRGGSLVHYPDKMKVRNTETDGAKTIIYVNQNIGSVQGGEVVGVRPDADYHATVTTKQQLPPDQDSAGAHTAGDRKES